MLLTPHEQDRLLLSYAAELAPTTMREQLRVPVRRGPSASRRLPRPSPRIEKPGGAARRESDTGHWCRRRLPRSAATRSQHPCGGGSRRAVASLVCGAATARCRFADAGVAPRSEPSGSPVISTSARNRPWSLRCTDVDPTGADGIRPCSAARGADQRRSSEAAKGFWSGSLHADVEVLVRHRIRLGNGSVSDDELDAPLACFQRHFRQRCRGGRVRWRWRAGAACRCGGKRLNWPLSVCRPRNLL
jgi:hypothetical protein